MTFTSILTHLDPAAAAEAEAATASPLALAEALDLSHIYAAPITRLGCLAFEGQGAFTSQS
jgi:hypothetical protein